MSSRRAADRYGDPGFRRLALAPGLLAAVVLFVGVALIGTEYAIYVGWGVAVLALIVIVFAFQAKQWWWFPPLAAIAVLWNPVVDFGLDGPWWIAVHYLAVGVFIAAGVLIKVPVPDEGRR